MFSIGSSDPSREISCAAQNANMLRVASTRAAFAAAKEEPIGKFNIVQ
jgi:hypothetical protein